MATKKPTSKAPRRSTRPRAVSVPVLRRRVEQLEQALAAAARRHARRLAAVRRDADRRLAAMVQEIAQLRHFQAREEALTRLLAERDAQLAALADRLPTAGSPETGAAPPLT